MITLASGLNGSRPTIAPFCTGGEPGKLVMERVLSFRVVRVLGRRVALVAAAVSRRSRFATRLRGRPSPVLERGVVVPRRFADAAAQIADPIKTAAAGHAVAIGHRSGTALRNGLPAPVADQAPFASSRFIAAFAAEGTPIGALNGSGVLQLGRQQSPAAFAMRLILAGAEHDVMAGRVRACVQRLGGACRLGAER